MPEQELRRLLELGRATVSAGSVDADTVATARAALGAMDASDLQAVAGQLRRAGRTQLAERVDRLPQAPVWSDETGELARQLLGDSTAVEALGALRAEGDLEPTGSAQDRPPAPPPTAEVPAPPAAPPEPLQPPQERAPLDEDAVVEAATDGWEPSTAFEPSFPSTELRVVADEGTDPSAEDVPARVADAAATAPAPAAEPAPPPPVGSGGPADLPRPDDDGTVGAGDAAPRGLVRAASGRGRTRDRDLPQLDAELGAVAAASSARQRFVALTEVPVDAVDPDEVVRLLRATPAGWQRRRVLLRLLDRGMTGLDPGQVLACFDRPGDRVTVADRLVRHEVAELETVLVHLPRAAAGRLRSRHG